MVMNIEDCTVAKTVHFLANSVDKNTASYCSMKTFSSVSRKEIGGFYAPKVYLGCEARHSGGLRILPTWVSLPCITISTWVFLFYAPI